MRSQKKSEEMKILHHKKQVRIFYYDLRYKAYDTTLTEAFGMVQPGLSHIAHILVKYL